MTQDDRIPISADSLERMKAELDDLVTRGRAEMSERLKRARDHGDIRENADYDAAKDAQGMMEARIRTLEETIKHAVVRKAGGAAEEAAPGVIVTVKEEGTDDPEEYFLAASNEDKIEGMRTITLSSPLGKAIAGRKSGDSVQVEAPGGSFTVEIVSLRPG
jgi:transcription elongation factor GreA